MARLTQEEFVRRSIEIHDGRYDYSLVKYDKNSIKVDIICRIHGVFQQTPATHLRGKGCMRCGGSYQYTNGEYIERATLIHGGKYSYCLTEYKNYYGKVRITCETHGEFSQSAGGHLDGRGCPKCASGCWDKDEFISIANERYNFKYDYGRIEFIGGVRDKVEIICPFHGLFHQSPEHHLRSNSTGCRLCGRMRKAAKMRGQRPSNAISEAEFIYRAVQVHGDKYIYDKVIYKTMHRKVTITCKKHDDFQRKPQVHLLGSGCPICSRSDSIGERAVKKYLNDSMIDYEPEKYVRGIGRFDFIVELDRGTVVIEFQGAQHYIPVTFGSSNRSVGINVLNNNIVRDYIKEKWCRERGYSLLAIPYWDRDRIPVIVETFLLGGQPEFGKPPEEVVDLQLYRDDYLKEWLEGQGS